MITDKKCGSCRRAGEKLFLKGEKCFTPKCVFVKKPYTPGKIDSERKHRSVMTEYGTQLKEKQKVRNVYGLSERQFGNYVKAASLSKDTKPTDKLYEMLERRLDNVVFRMGLGRSRTHARQLVAHGHVLVNGRRSTSPSHQVRIGDVISVRAGSKERPLFVETFKKLADKSTPSWLTLKSDVAEGEIKALPREKIMPFNFTSVIEFYSR
ncbi:MAG: 30S ribosomal protein S4 [Candidatus Paceibacterota bacterium]|jgi:small subunit ribosomal protein S4